MSDDNAAPTGDGQQQSSAPQTFQQADVDRIVAERLGRERQKFADYDDLKGKAAQVELLQGQLNETTTGKTTAEKTALRYQIAYEKGVPPGALDFLDGDTREDLEAKAERLLALAAKPDVPANGDPAPRPDLSQGARSSDLPLNGDPLLRDVKAKLGIR